MPLVRDERWPERLASFIEERRHAPFAWGSNDCSLFACDAMLAMTGIDIAAEFRGKYSDELGALRCLKDHAGGALEATAEKIAAQFGLLEIPPLHAQRGDVAIIPTTNGPALGVVIGEDIVAAGPSGVAFFSLRDVQRAWRI